MRLVLKAEAVQFHSDEIQQRYQPHSVHQTRAPQLGRWFRIIEANFLARKHHMNCPARGRGASLHEHVNPGYVSVLQTEWLNRLGDIREVLAANHDVDIFGQSASVRLFGRHINIGREPSYDCIIQARCGEGLLDSLGELK